MNPLYNQIMGQSRPSIPMMSPVQRMGQIIQAMQNPVEFVRRNIPGIPEQAFSDPTGNSVLQYMIQNLGVTQQDIQNASGQIPRF